MLHTVLKRRLLTAANLIATLMAALASCDDTDPRRLDPAMCAPVLDEGLAPAAAGPPRWEPPPYPFARPPGTQTESGLLLPENFNTTSYYPIEVGTGAHFRLQFMIGQEISELHHVYVYVLVEGRPVEVLAEGADSTPRIVVDIASGLADVEVEIPPEALQPGLNQVDLAQVFHIGDRYLFGRANSFTVANGTAAYAAPPETELPPGEFAPGAIAQVFRMGEGSTAEDELFFRLYRSSHGPLPDPLQLVLRLQPTSPWSTCAGAEDVMVVLAFDNENLVRLGDYDRIVTHLSEGEQRVVRYTVPLWPSGERHDYHIVAYTGFGRLARLSGGGMAPWRSSRVLSEVTWGPE